MNTIIRYRTPILLFTIPGIAVAWGVVMITMATQYPDALVVDDYYRDGMAINVSRDRSETAERLAVHVDLRLGQQELTAQVTTAVDRSDEAITLQFSHVVDASRDLSLELHRSPDGLFRMRDHALTALTDRDAWYITVSNSPNADEPWRVTRRIDTPFHSLTVGTP